MYKYESKNTFKKWIIVEHQTAKTLYLSTQKTSLIFSLAQFLVVKKCFFNPASSSTIDVLNDEGRQCETML